MNLKAYMTKEIVLENDGGKVVHHVTLILPRLSAAQVSNILGLSEQTCGELDITINE